MNGRCINIHAQLKIKAIILSNKFFGRKYAILRDFTQPTASQRVAFFRALMCAPQRCDKARMRP